MKKSKKEPVNSANFGGIHQVTFIDEDLDLRDLGGYISWEHPLDVKQVTAYHVYISCPDSNEAV